jgi:hypothetical protein
MFDKPRFIVSFIVNNQPQSRTLEDDRETLAPSEAEALAKQTFAELKGACLSDVQVQKSPSWKKATMSLGITNSPEFERERPT